VRILSRHGAGFAMTSHIVLLPANRMQRPGEALRFAIADAFARIGFSAEVLDVNAAPRNLFAGRASLFASIDPWRAAKILFRRRQAYAVVSYYQSGALVILALRRLLGFKPLVAIIDVGDDSNWPLRARIVAYCLKRADAVFSFSRDQSEYLKRRYPGARVQFLPQQIDTRFFSPSDGEGDYILSVGNDLSRDYTTLETAVFDLGVPVTLRTDRVAAHANVAIVPRGSDEDLRRLYQGAKLVVLPLHDMRHPGGISSLLEAFACGKAVVASNARGIRDYLHHEENCLVVPCGDAAALRAAVVRLLEDGALRKRLGAAARRNAETELSQDRYVTRLADAFAAIRSMGPRSWRMEE
jgi:glycosyltransferase involved in cell wall biosynthesis